MACEGHFSQPTPFGALRELGVFVAIAQGSSRRLPLTLFLSLSRYFFFSQTTHHQLITTTARHGLSLYHYFEVHISPHHRTHTPYYTTITSHTTTPSPNTPPLHIVNAPHLAEVFHHAFLLGVAQQAVGPRAPRKRVKLLSRLMKKRDDNGMHNQKKSREPKNDE